MKVTVLVENTSSEDLKGEHGLSLHIEHNGKDYLIDTGKSGLYLENANKIGVDLSNVNTAFLSHAHYDHSGGFNEFFNINSKASVYLQESCRDKYYYKIKGPIKKYIGIPKGILEQYDNRFEYLGGFKEIDDGVFICPHSTDGLNARGKRTNMYSKVNGELLVDDFSHEQTVVFEENEELYLFNSCSHGGVENIIEEIKEIFPNKEIKAFFGGFHMMGARGVNSCVFSQKEVENTAKTILKSSNATFYTGHCTGNVASKWLKEVLKDRFVQLQTGKVVDF